MIKWTKPGYPRIDQSDLPSYLDDSAFDLYAYFEEDFNSSRTPLDVLYDCGGDEAYHQAFREWLEDLVDTNPEWVEDMTGFAPISASRKPVSKASKPKVKAPAKKAAKPKSKGARR